MYQPREKVFEITFLVNETYNNGNQRIHRHKVYVSTNKREDDINQFELMCNAYSIAKAKGFAILACLKIRKMSDYLA